MDIYVGNISYQLSEADLQNLFEEFGEVNSVKIVTDKMTGKSKGFGFIGMNENDAAHRAIESLNGREIQGRNLVVNEARQKEEGDAPRKSFGQGGGGNRFRSDSRGGSGGGYQKDSGRSGGGRDRDKDRNRGDRFDGGNRW